MNSVGKLLRRASELADPALWRNVKRAAIAYRHAPTFTCPCCGYVGKFDSSGTVMNRPNAQCRQCGSLERHRVLALAVNEGFVSFAGKKVLHFAPEKIIRSMVEKARPASYVTADIVPGVGDLVLNIEKLELEDGSFDRVICSHVLEHVNDTLALPELLRILAPGGQAILMVPLVDGWDGSYEDPSITTKADRHKHFGQGDHIRYYGGDFAARVKAAGFALDRFTPDGRACAEYGLVRGEAVFRASRPD
jgi:SAM-dependent methyltransferase